MMDTAPEFSDTDKMAEDEADYTEYQRDLGQS